MNTAEQASEILEESFSTIEKDRMHDIPILNRKLSVKAIGFRQWGDYWFGVLLTPWFMNLVLLPKEDCAVDWSKEEVGSKHNHSFPAGTFEFIVGHETTLGHFMMCSLFSPMFEFADQETAELTASTVIETVFLDADPADKNQDDEDMQKIWEGKLPEDPLPADQDAQINQANSQSSTRAQEAPKALSRRELLGGIRKNFEEQSP